MAVDRQTVDLSAYPDLVVFYLGIRVRRPRGMLRLLGLGPQIQKSWKAQPDGLLLHEDFIRCWSPHWGRRCCASPANWPTAQPWARSDGPNLTRSSPVTAPPIG
jgi:hypothetical protein